MIVNIRYMSVILTVTIINLHLVVPFISAQDSNAAALPPNDSIDNSQGESEIHPQVSDFLLKGSPLNLPSQLNKLNISNNSLLEDEYKNVESAVVESQDGNADGSFPKDSALIAGEDAQEEQDDGNYNDKDEAVNEDDQEEMDSNKELQDSVSYPQSGPGLSIPSLQAPSGNIAQSQSDQTQFSSKTVHLEKGDPGINTDFNQSEKDSFLKSNDLPLEIPEKAEIITETVSNVDSSIPQLPSLPVSLLPKKVENQSSDIHVPGYVMSNNGTKAKNQSGFSVPTSQNYSAFTNKEQYIQIGDFSLVNNQTIRPNIIKNVDLSNTNRQDNNINEISNNLTFNNFSKNSTVSLPTSLQQNMSELRNDKEVPGSSFTEAERKWSVPVLPPYTPAVQNDKSDLSLSDSLNDRITTKLEEIFGLTTNAPIKPEIPYNLNNQSSLVSNNTRFDAIGSQLSTGGQVESEDITNYVKSNDFNSSNSVNPISQNIISENSDQFVGGDKDNDVGYYDNVDDSSYDDKDDENANHGMNKTYYDDNNENNEYDVSKDVDNERSFDNDKNDEYDDDKDDEYDDDKDVDKDDDKNDEYDDEDDNDDVNDDEYDKEYNDDKDDEYDDDDVDDKDDGYEDEKDDDDYSDDDDDISFDYDKDGDSDDRTYDNEDPDSEKDGDSEEADDNFYRAKSYNEDEEDDKYDDKEMESNQMTSVLDLMKNSGVTPTAPTGDNVDNSDYNDNDEEENDDWYNPGPDEDSNDYDEDDDDNDEDDAYKKWDDDDEDEEGSKVTDDFDEDEEDGDAQLIEEVVGDELAKKNKPPTGPSSMVIFYTWMVVALLVVVIILSTYQTRCKGVKLPFSNGRSGRDDKKRLLDHEYA